MSRRFPSTYEYVHAGEQRWIVSHASEHAQACAEARGWPGKGRVAFGPLLTALVISESDADVVLDEEGRPVGIDMIGANQLEAQGYALNAELPGDQIEDEIGGMKP